MKPLKFSIILLALLSGQAVAADQGTDYGIVLQRFDTISQQFTDAISPAAQKLFFSLVCIDVALLAKNYLWGDDPAKALKSLVMRVFFYGFIWAVMLNDWLLDVMMSFMQLGMQGAGMSGFQVGDLMREGLNLIATMINNYNDGAGGQFAVLTNPFAAFTIGFCVILTLVSFLILVAQYVVIRLQMYVYVAIAPLLLAFGGLKYTKDLALKTMSASIVIGVRIIMIFFVIAIAHELVPLMGADIARSSVSNLLPLLSAVSMAGLLAFLAIKGPSIASDLLSGSASLSAGDAASTPGVAAAAGAAAGAVAGGISSAASAAGKAANDGFTPLREAVAAATSGGSPSTASGFSPDAGTGGGGNNNGSGFSSRDLTPSWMKVENSASTTTMGGDSAGTNSGTNRTGFNSGASTNAENSGSSQSNNNAQTRQNQDANRAGSGAVSGGSPGPAETVANGESSGVSGEKGSELNSAASTSSALSGESLNATSGQAGTDFNSGPAPESGAIGGRSSDQSEALAGAASVGSGSGFQAEGGSIGGVGATDQTSQPNNSAVADYVSRGLQEFAQAEKSSGASVNIQAGHEDI